MSFENSETLLPQHLLHKQALTEPAGAFDRPVQKEARPLAAADWICPVGGAIITFSPDSSRLCFSSQRGSTGSGSNGVSFEVRGPFLGI